MRSIYVLLLKKKHTFLFSLILLLPIFLAAQSPGTKDITGKVTDNTGTPLSGVTVTARSSNAASVTNNKGAYNVKAKEGDVLIFSSVSYAQKEVTVGAVSSYDVTLQATIATLSDVVVVGYGKSSRKNLSSSITTIKPGDLNKGAISDVGQLLQGKVAGLNITASGDPNKSAAVILRGASTINSPGAPFYVIDGVPGADIAVIAPDDIASIDVLKDAAATAIYGNRASSGVIIVTTKRGRSGQMQTAYNGYVGFENVTSNLNLMDAPQLRAYLDANGASFSPSDDLNANTDWVKAIQKTSAVSHNHNLSFSGGGEHNNYSASINYLEKEGILKSSDLKRLIARLSVEQYALNNKVKFSLNVSNSNSNASYTPLQNIVLIQATRHLPVSPLKNPDGSFFENFNTTGYFNPLALIDHATDETKYNSLVGGFSTEVKLPFSLTYNVNLFYQRTTSLHGEYYDSYYTKYPSSNFYNNPDPGIGISHTLIGNLFGTNGSALRSTYQNTTKTIESYLTFNKKFGDHSINAVAGYSWQDNTYGDGFQASSTNFPADNIGFNNLTLGNPYALPNYRVQFGNDQTFGQTRLISDFGRLNYGYNDKYLLQASLRRDGGSVFGKNNTWGYFPSVGVAWRVTQESFLQNNSFLNEFKIRGSYGETGNSQGFGAYTALFLYGTTGTFYDNGVQAGAYGPIQGYNPDLKWERTATTNIGADFTILSGKITGTFDWYSKKTTGMIFKYSVSPALVPGGSIYANGGSMTNKGVELSLNATPVSRSNFRWTTTLNLAHNTNLITDLTSPYGNGDSIRYSDPEGPGQTNSTLQILKVGKPLGQFFSLQYAGKDQSGNSQFMKHDGSTTTAPAIGVDYFYIGNAQPKLLLGWNNSFSYKNFDLNVFVRGVFGSKIFDATRADLFYVASAAINNISADAADDKITDTKNSSYSTRFIESGDYLRFDNATLAYTFKMKNDYINSLRLYTSVNNLFVITGYKGIDPEINQGGAAPGIDYNNFYPKTRTILFGVNVSF
ncbi:MAG: SusC/RagA family TonB-linked outer membrane protein [Ginsengibacter sp.]